MTQDLQPEVDWCRQPTPTELRREAERQERSPWQLLVTGLALVGSGVLVGLPIGQTCVGFLLVMAAMPCLLGCFGGRETARLLREEADRREAEQKDYPDGPHPGETSRRLQ